MVIVWDLPLGRRLRVLRIARGLRQKDLANAAGLSDSAVSMVENGERLPRDQELDAILRALGARPEDVDLPRRTK